MLSYLRGDDLLRGEKALTGTAAVLETLDRRQLSPYIQLGGNDPNSRRRIDSVYVAYKNAAYGWIYAYQPTVRRAVNYIAVNVAQLGLKVYKRISDDEREHAGDHPAAEALRWPNAWTPGQHFIKTFVRDWLVYDDAYAIKFPSDSGLTLVNIPPHLVGIVGRSYYQPEGYEVQDQNGGKVFVPLERMVHWRGDDPNDPRQGLSKLETLREELASDAAGRQAITELYKSGLTAPAVILRPLEAPEWSQEGAARFAEGLANAMKQGARRPVVLEEGMTIDRNGVSPEDAELLDTRRWTNEQVASIFGMKNVPPEGKEELSQFYTDVLAPITEICAAFLDLHVLIGEYDAKDHYFEFNLDEKLMGDDRLKALTSAAGGPVLTRNEARARLNLPAKDDGDDLITPLNVTEGGKPSPQVMPPQDANRPPQDGSARSDDAPTPIPARRASLNGHHKAAQLLLPRRVAKDRRRNESAEDYETAIKGFLTHMERSLKSRHMDAKAVADDRWEQRLAGEIDRVARKQVQREGEVTAARLASSFDLERTLEYIGTVAKKKADEIAGALRDRLKAGDDASDVFEAARNAATPTAAMTLATSFSKFATREAAEQDTSGAQRFKTWIVTSANSSHPEMDGESVPLGESFSNGSDGPPADHPGCQCLMEIDAGGFPAKAIPNGEVKVINQAPQTQPPINVTVNFPPLPEGMIQSHTFVEGMKAPDVLIQQGDTHNHVEPAQLHVAEGAVQSFTNVEGAQPAQISFDKGAFAISSPVNVEAAPPADIRFVEGAMQANITLPEQKAPEVNVEVKGGKTKRILTFSDGRTAEVETTTDNKRTVTFSDGRTAEITESEE